MTRKVDWREKAYSGAASTDGSVDTKSSAIQFVTARRDWKIVTESSAYKTGLVEA